MKYLVNTFRKLTYISFKACWAIAVRKPALCFSTNSTIITGQFSILTRIASYFSAKYNFIYCIMRGPYYKLFLKAIIYYSNKLPLQNILCSSLLSPQSSIPLHNLFNKMHRLLLEHMLYPSGHTKMNF